MNLLDGRGQTQHRIRTDCGSGQEAAPTERGTKGAEAAVAVDQNSTNSAVCAVCFLCARH